jgi:hypothetical protein
LLLSIRSRLIVQDRPQDHRSRQLLVRTYLIVNCLKSI